VVRMPVLNENAGTFCYRGSGRELSSPFLLGCAGSNGGNVLDWAEGIFGSLPCEISRKTDPPTFIPLLNGERSPEWNESLTASWHGLRSDHTAADLSAAVLEGVVFNLAHYVEILQRTSSVSPQQIVLSGNGFLKPMTAQILASIVGAQVLRPQDQGLASLRGAAICALEALGGNPEPAVEKVVAASEAIAPLEDCETLLLRYRRYRECRVGSLTPRRFSSVLATYHDVW